MTALGLFVLGLIIITIGAEIMLKGASKIASLLGIHPILIGLTVVSIGTSLPELAVGLTAIKDGAADMAIGNIAGTNLANILFVLGLSAAIRPLPLHIKAIKFEMMVMIIAAVLLLLLCLDGTLSFWDGLIMFVLGIVYLFITIKSSPKEPREIQKEYYEEYKPSSFFEKHSILIWTKNIIFLVIGIAGTIWGADLLVAGAVDMAKKLGMSDAVIGLTIIALGTSAPEFITTIVATFKNDRDVAIGNLLGSSITNIFIILAITSLFVPSGIEVNSDILWFDLPLAALVTIACYPVFKSDHKVSRVEGIFFVAIYLCYLIYLLNFRA